MKRYFLGPTLIVIAFNMFIIIILLLKVIKLNPERGVNAKRGSKLKQIFGFSSLTINLGITWILFLLYLHKWSPYFSTFSYAFIALNGSQVSYFLSLNYKKKFFRKIFFI
jgi:hypothetical protein